ncbi:MAG TPA: LLM class flavin-dependent oxidoreductase [Stellaceae bacterium]
MRFMYFHLMPWTEGTEPVEDWPVANKGFDPVRGTELYRTYIDNLAFAEECGFDFVACNEHHMSPYGLMSNANIIGAALTQRLKHIGIAMVGSLVPLLNPIRVAEEYAMLDVISGGKLMAGILRGIPHEYVAYNVSPSESYGRLVEACELIKRCWTEPEPFGWEGTYYQFRAVSIWPRPRQQPHPPIIMSGSSAHSCEIAAEQHAILGMAQVADIARARAQIDIYKRRARECGWEPGPEHILIGQNTCIADSFDEAKRLLEGGRRYFAQVLGGGIRTAQRLVLQQTRYYDEGAATQFRDARQSANIGIEEAIANGSVLCGTPDMVIDQLRRLHRELGHGFTQINMKIGNIPDEAIHHGMRLFKDKILPEVRAL